ncbi:hypothetical protein MLD38_030688 [Melastoma candidum]|uniref:Uncharacterized protein n=1 Tax=Melastoma candidum TaxID=119954 RepID=A0ACB9MMI1_9MYRT|nr:hypothetical protein MLD38_030688 [Melastoma candidum]
MNKLALENQPVPARTQSLFPDDCWFDDSCILDMDYFVKTLSGIKAKGVRPDLIGSIISHYASKWLPELSPDGQGSEINAIANHEFASSPESITSSWMKKRFFMETLVGVLPPEKDSVPCNFLLRLLRTANMVGVEPAFRTELEKRISWQLDQASLKELMIPSFSHTSGTLLDVDLMLRLVKRFVNLDVEGARSGTTAAMIQVARLVDAYLAEAAIDMNLSLEEFMPLASILPSYARATDDGLYRAIDTYLKMHPSVPKQDRKDLCRLMDCQKLSPEASLHASLNERLPVRAVIQVLISEQSKLNNRNLDWSGSFNGTNRSPTSGCLDAPPARCLSKREMNFQQAELRRLRDDVHRLQGELRTVQGQLEKVLDRKKRSMFFRWRKHWMLPSLRNDVSFAGEDDEHGAAEANFWRLTPGGDMKTRLVKGRAPPKWRKSTS